MSPAGATTPLATMVEYTAWAGAVVLRECKGLTQDQLTRDLGGTQGTLLRLLRHVYDAEQGWLRMLQVRRLPSLGSLGGDRVDAPETLAALAEAWPSLWAEWKSWVRSLSEEDLRCPLQTSLPDGRPVTLPLEDVLLHVVNHSSLHRGQMVTMLRMVGAPCRSVDLMGYVVRRELGAFNNA